MAYDLNNTISFQEWKSCQETLGSLDKILVDLRKYGFSLVTILLSANGFLFSQTPPGPWIVVGISAALLILIAGLFRQDRVHEVFIRGAALRAMKLEKNILDELGVGDSNAEKGSFKCAGMGLSYEISRWSELINTGTWGVQLYIVFCGAVGVLGAAGISRTAAGGSNGAVWANWSLMAVAIIWIWMNHRHAAPLETAFKDFVKQRNNAFGYTA